MFKFELMADVTIAASGARGVVVSRLQAINSGPRYLIRYRAADGRAVEAWWDEDALAKTPEIACGECSTTARFVTGGGGGGIETPMAAEADQGAI